jgi:tRNA(fMet)-specific endonuclease VapC
MQVGTFLFAGRVRVAGCGATEGIGIGCGTQRGASGRGVAYVAKARTKAQQIDAYGLLAKHLDDYREARILLYDHSAANILDELRAEHLRLGTMDLRIAAIALGHRALLVTRNLKDFGKIRNLRVEDWTSS